MDARKRRAIALQIKRTVGNIVRGIVLKREFLLPFVAVLHLTYDCNCKCNFCSRKKEVRGNKRRRRCDIGLVERVLRSVKELTPSLYVTGGEPLLEKSVGDVLRLARQIGFWPVCLNTNATVLNKHPDVPKYADRIVVSLHAGTPKRHAKILGVSRRQGERVFDNIVQASAAAKSYGNELSVNCVLTSDNIGEARGVLRFCLEHEIPIAVVPAICGHMPAIMSGEADRLREYRDFLDEVIWLKKRCPHAVVGTRSYLQHIHRLGGFECRPSGVITISPEGCVVNPCDFKYGGASTLGQVDDKKPLEVQLYRHLNYTSVYESCGGNCLKMCYLEPALVLRNPWLAIGEFLS